MRHATHYERNAPAEAVIDRALAATRLAVPWLEDVEAAGLRRPHPPLQGARTADLVVIGGGFAGLWTAVLAARRAPGRRIVLLEAARLGWAASGRNGGWIDYSITHGEENGAARWPDEFATLQRLGLANLDALVADVAEFGIDSDLARVGALILALEEHERPWTRELDRLPDATTLDAAALRSRLRAPAALGAIAESGRMVATAHPARLVLGLAAAAERLGVTIHERSRVTELQTGGAGVTAVTPHGAVIAAQAVLATNAFPSLLRRNRAMTVPVYDYALMTAPLTTAQRDAIGWRGREALGDMANQFHYAQITPDGRILWGGYDAVYRSGGRIRAAYEDRLPTHRRLAAHFFALFPQLVDAGVTFTHRWGGVIDTSTRFAAFAGTARDRRVAYAAGFTGLGVGTTRFTAEVMLDLLDGVENERTSLAMVRHRGLPFPPEPLASFGIGVSRRAMDAADHHAGRRNLWLRTMDALGLGFDS